MSEIFPLLSMTRVSAKPSLLKALESVQLGEVFKAFAVTAQVSSRISFPGSVFHLDQRTFFPSASRQRAEEIYESTLHFLHTLDEPILH